MDSDVRLLQNAFRGLEEDAAESLGDLHDPTLDTVAEDGRTIRQVIYELSDHYRERIEQLLWAKWGQRIQRSESKRALADLQGARARFAAYFTDLRNGQLDTCSAGAQDSSPRDVIVHALEEERKAMVLLRKALEL